MKRKICLLLTLILLLSCLCACERQDKTENATNPIETPAEVTYSLEGKTTEEIITCIQEIINTPINSTQNYQEFITQWDNTYPTNKPNPWPTWSGSNEIWSVRPVGLVEDMDGTVRTEQESYELIFLLNINNYDIASSIYDWAKTEYGSNYSMGQDMDEPNANGGPRIQYVAGGNNIGPRYIVEMQKLKQEDVSYYHIKLYIYDLLLVN